jgi:hypothetical protein
MTRLIVAVVAAWLCAATASAQGVPANAGVYVLNSVASTQALPTAAYSSGYIDGVTLVFYWNTIETADGVFNWSAVDSQIAAAAAAGKKVNLGVLPGVFTPSWVYAEGAVPFTMTWNDPGWGFPLCSLVPLPVPWDPIYITKWGNFIKRLAQRYANNPALAMLKIQGVNADTPELILPYTRPTGTGPGPYGCAQVDNVAAWLAVGYRPAKIVSAWGDFATLYARLFPNQYLILEAGSWPLPPINNAGQTSPAVAGDYGTPKTIMAQGVTLVGSRLVVENDSLTDIYAWARPAALPAANEFAYQDAWNVDQDPRCRMNGGVIPCDPATVMSQTVTLALNRNIAFLEVYQTDAQDAAEAPALTVAHDALTGQPSP